MKLCIIIDGYSTGKNYARILKKENYQVLHIQSNYDLPNFITKELESDNYIATLVYRTFDKIIEQINTYGKPEFIIPGSDTGVALSDLLSHHFNLLKKNSLEKSAARRDKFIMGETIRKAGVRAIKQTKTDDCDYAISWISDERINYPVVVKPIKSGSGEGFFLCHTSADISDAFKKLIGQKDLFNQINHEVLVQEYISGKEYVVNTVSCEGKHVVSDYYLYHKKITEDGHSIYEAIEFLPFDFTYAEILKNYAFSVLDALEIQYGPAHAEIIMSNDEPVLVEIGARPAGADLDLNILRNTFRYSQIELSLMAYQDSTLFFETIKTLQNYIGSYLMMAFLNSYKSGKIIKFELSSISELASTQKIELFRSKGDFVCKTAHLDDAVGVVYLQHEDKQIIDKDQLFLTQLHSTNYLQLSQHEQ